MSINFLKLRSGIEIGTLDAAPGSPTDGEVYYDSVLSKFQFRQNGTWVDISGIPTGSSNSFALFDGTGTLTSGLGYNFDPAAFNGLRLNHTVVADATTNGNLLHDVYTAINPSTPSKNYWTQIFSEVEIGTDDSGFQLGNPIDIKSTLVLQDLTYTSKRYGQDGDVISIEYIGGGVAGSEVVSNIDFAYTVQIEDGVSTADQIKTALDAYTPFTGTVTVVVSGTGSNPQTVVAPTNLAGGENVDGGVTLNTVNGRSTRLSNVGRVNVRTGRFELGNGTDPLAAYDIHTEASVVRLNDYAKAFNVTMADYGIESGNLNDGSDNVSRVESDFRGVNIYGQLRKVGGGVLGYQLGVNLTDIRYAQSFVTTLNVVNVAESMNSFADFNQVTGTITNTYYGVSVQPNINIANQGMIGVNVTPNIALNKGNAVGINVGMGGVTNYAGVQASVVIQDITLTGVNPGTDLNNYTVVYVSDVTAGNEFVSIAQPVITVHIESGVSTATQVFTAMTNTIGLVSNVTPVITGTGSNPQVSGSYQFSGGENSGTKRAANFDGDVTINGSLSFNGDLGIGRLSAYKEQTLVNGGGAPGSVHTLISAPTVAANVTTANADLIGVNTAALITLGDNSVTTTAFLGITALGLPAVLSMGSGSTVDHVAGATFALSLDGSATGGTVDVVDLCQALALPNGITTVNKLHGYALYLPFGGIATDTWGVYIAPDCLNWMAGSLKIGGTAGSTDRVTNSSIDLEVDAVLRKVPIDTTARDALTAVAGMEIYNTTTNQPEYYDGSTWTGYSSGVGLTTPTTSSTFGNTTAPGLSGTRNTVIGVGAGIALTTGGSNAILGSSAGAAIQDSVQNVVIGNDSAINMVGGGDNTVIGNAAGSGIASSISNVIIGASSASEPVGNRNVVIGAGAGVSSGAAQSIAIGFNAVASSNIAVLGSTSAPAILTYLGYGEFTANGGADVAVTTTNGFGTDNSISSVMRVLGGSGTGTGTGGDVALATAPASGSSSSNINGPVDRIRIKNTGEVGVATTTPVSGLDVNTSIGRKTDIIATDTTLDSTHNVVLADATGGVITLTLPSAASAARRVYTIKKVDAISAVTVLADGADTIDGAPSAILATQYDFVTIISDGVSAWFIIGN